MNRADIEKQIAYHRAEEASHKRGTMMSMAEAIQGEGFHCREAERYGRMLADLPAEKAPEKHPKDMTVEELIADVATLPDPERSLLSHNERVLIELARALGKALAYEAAKPVPASGGVEAVRGAIKKLAKEGDLVIYETADDRGLEEDEYLEVFLKIAALASSTPAEAEAASLSPEERESRMQSAIVAAKARSHVPQPGWAPSDDEDVRGAWRAGWNEAIEAAARIVTAEADITRTSRPGRSVSFDRVAAEIRARTLATSPAKVRHVKRGSTYDVIGEGEVQISTGFDDRERGAGTKKWRRLTEGDHLVAYRAHSDGKLWLRFPDEFNDPKRFERIG